MSATDLIGWLVSFFGVLAFMFLYLKQVAEERSSKKHEEEFEERSDEEDEWLKHLAKPQEPIKKGMDRLKPPPLNPLSLAASSQKISSLREYHLISDIETRSLRSGLADRQLETALTERVEKRSESDLSQPYPTKRQRQDHLHSRIQKKKQSLSDNQDLIIYHEIIARPKSLRGPLW
jgi:hypothetical protein